MIYRKMSKTSDEINAACYYWLCMQWDGPPQGGHSHYGASGWNRPSTLPSLDKQFDVERAKKEARERIKDQHRKVGGWVGVDVGGCGCG